MLGILLVLIGLCNSILFFKICFVFSIVSLFSFALCFCCYVFCILFGVGLNFQKVALFSGALHF